MTPPRITKDQFRALQSGDAVQPKPKRRQANYRNIPSPGVVSWPAGNSGRRCAECRRLMEAFGAATRALSVHRRDAHRDIDVDGMITRGDDHDSG